jgi:hypothetical protein
MVIYLTTNLVNGKKYIGLDVKNDNSYYGSGIHIKRAIKKYGKENFTKEILEICDNREELILCEKKWIKTYNAVESKEFYNVHEGGIGGDVTQFMDEFKIQEWKKNISEGKRGRTKGIPLTEKNKKGISQGLKQYYSNGGIAPLQGKPRDEETKMKISESNKGKKFTDEHLKNLKESLQKRDYNGEKNPFYGKGDMISGEKNPMYGKSFYDVWVEKYGKDIADKKKEEWLNKKRKKNGVNYDNNNEKI